MASGQASAKTIRSVLRALEAAMGRQHWWPAGSAFEVVVGAYLTQNTAWSNVELAMGNLRRAGVLSISGIRNTTLEELEQLVRPAGYFRQKAARLKRFVAHLDTCYGGSLDALFDRPTEALREELLELPGIGQETADSILLYAASREVFVVDTYTRRIFERHGLVKADTKYEEVRLGVQKALTEEAGAGKGEGEKKEREQQPDQQPLQGQQAQGRQSHLNAAETEARREDGAPGAGAVLVAGEDGAPGAGAVLVTGEDGVSGASADGAAGGAGADGATQIPTRGTQAGVHAPSAASRMERSELSQRYNEFHALLVQTAKHYCGKSTPKCESCPLLPLLPPGGPL